MYTLNFLQLSALILNHKIYEFSYDYHVFIQIDSEMCAGMVRCVKGE